MEKRKLYDVIIIGGSYAGLSAGLALGRSKRKVLIIDNGKPCNASTPYSHNFLTQDGVKPDLIADIARQQLQVYPNIHFLNETVLNLEQDNGVFNLRLSDSSIAMALKIILASGLKDNLPKIDGFEECWGKTVIHCPYCHGYEFKNKPTGILASGDKAIHLAGLVHNLTTQLSVFTNGDNTLTPSQKSKLADQNIALIDTPLQSIQHHSGNISTIFLKNGTQIELQALYASIPFVIAGNYHQGLNFAFTENGLIKVDSIQQTNIAGIFACGDMTSPMRSVANAVYTGNVTGAMVNMQLVNERF